MAPGHKTRRIVITGMGINTPLGDTLDAYYDNLIAGKSAITKWKWLERDDLYSKVGGDLTEYDIKAKVKSLRETLPAGMHQRLRKLRKTAPFSTGLSLAVAADAWIDAGRPELDPTRCSTLVGGHNLNDRYIAQNHVVFRDEDPDFIDNLASLLLLDTDHAGSVSELLGWKGAAYTLGGACASAGHALRSAVDEIRHHDQNMAIVVGAALDFSPMGLHAMGLLGAITFQSFNDEPEKASRPYDTRREGFVPCHGAAALILEDLEHALSRGARIYAEVLGATATADASHLPAPSTEGQARTIERLLHRNGVGRDEVDFICAHATSTPLGDVSEINAIKRVFGDHAKRLKINAPKSMLGHTCWSAPAVETVAGLLQMNRGTLHPSINIDQLDPAVDLDVCANEAVEWHVDVMLKNSFGFGGLNCCALYRRFDPATV